MHTDHLNTPRKIAQPSTGTLAWRYDADPFGTVAPNQNPGGLGTFVYNLRAPGQYYMAETGLNQNVNRDYDPLTGRYLESDPLGLSAGINTYSYVFANPVQWADPSGLARQLDPNSQECKELAKKIENIKKDIEKRMREYQENPGNLPESVPGGKPRESREGHLGLIKELQETLAQREKEYAEKCGGQQCPSENNSTIQNIANALGISVTTYLIISEGSRLFPPRNAVPVP